MGRRRIGTRRSAVRPWRLMVLLALVGMALSSLGGAIAASQANPPPITQEEAEQADQPAIETAEPAATQPPETGEATEPAVAPTEEPPGEPVEQPPVGRESEEPPFFLQLVKRVCPAKDGFIPASAPYAELDDACRLEVADPASFFFIVTDATGEQQVANDIAPFFELPTGRTRAAEKHAGGYGDPIVWCTFGKGEPPQRMEVVSREVAFDPKPEMLVTCEFFNPELPPAPEASLTIHKRICAEGYDIGSEKADPIVDCTEPATKVPFALADDAPATPDQQQATGAVIASGVVFEGLAGGKYTVTETPPEGVTGAVVWTCEVDGRSVDGDQPPLSEGFTLELEIPAGAEVVCFWFNLRGGEPGADDDGSITVVKWVCPPGYDVTSGKADPLVDCTKPMDDVEFELFPEDRDVPPQKGATGDADLGTVTFDGLPAGSYTIEEELPEGIAGAFTWYCTDEPRQRQAPDAPLAEGTRLTVELATGQDLWCLWFNVLEERPVEPTPGTTPTPERTETATTIPTETASVPGGENTLTIYKWQCPDGAGYEQAPDWYAQHCELEMLNVPFTVRTANGASAAVSQANGTNFDDLPAGSLSVRETIPDGYGAPRVYCDPVDASTLTELPVVDGAVSFSIGDGGAEDIICHWYNIPQPSGGAAPLPTESTFVLGPSEPCGTATAVSVITIDPDEPCGTETETSVPVDDPDGPATVGTAAPDEGNTVTVRKWACPAGSEYGQSQAWYIERCVEPMDGIEFTLIDGNGVSSMVTEGGTARWTDVAAGNFGLQETIPEGYGEPVMYCQSDVLGRAVWNPLGGGGVTWGVSDDVEEPFSVDCDWYNVPLPGESGEPEPTLPMPWTPTPGASGAEATEPPAETGSIAVVKVTCPAGFDVDTGDPTRECGKLTDGISFTVTSEDGGTSQRARTGDDGRGRAVFDGLAASSYEIIEAAQDGTEPVVWACAASIRELAGADGPLAEGGSITVELSAGEDVTCLWLNLPAGGESAMMGEIRISAFACDPGFSRAAYDPVSLDDLRAGCTQPFTDLRLVLSGANIAPARVGMTDDAGDVTFANLALGDTYINQTPSSGSTYPIVYCGDSGSTPHEQATETFSATVTVTSGSTPKMCEWFVIPLTDDFHLNRITVTPIRCVEHPATGLCDPFEEPYTLTVSGDQGWEYSWTLEPGTWHVPSPPDQALTLLLEMPGEWESMLVKCSVVDWAIRSTVVDDLGWLEVSDAGTVSVPPIGTNNRLVCLWYGNVDGAYNPLTSTTLIHPDATGASAGIGVSSGRRSRRGSGRWRRG